MKPHNIIPANITRHTVHMEGIPLRVGPLNNLAPNPWKTDTTGQLYTIISFPFSINNVEANVEGSFVHTEHRFFFVWRADLPTR